VEKNQQEQQVGGEREHESGRPASGRRTLVQGRRAIGGQGLGRIRGSWCA
jgi:hypothetical protein